MSLTDGTGYPVEVSQAFLGGIRAGTTGILGLFCWPEIWVPFRFGTAEDRLHEWNEIIPNLGLQALQHILGEGYYIPESVIAIMHHTPRSEIVRVRTGLILEYLENSYSHVTDVVSLISSDAAK